MSPYSILFMLSLLSSLSVKATKVIEFHGGGIYFWWQAGAATYLSEHCHQSLHHPDSDIQLIGASAGAITASLLLAKANFSQAAEIAIDEVKKLNLWEGGGSLLGVWGDIVHNFLHRLFEPATLNARDLNRIHIAVTPRFIFSGTSFVSEFMNKEELMHAVLTSTHIPFFMNGRASRQFRDEHYVDGSIWYFTLRLPPPLPTSIAHKLGLASSSSNSTAAFSCANTAEDSEEVCETIGTTHTAAAATSTLSSSSSSVYSWLSSRWTSLLSFITASPPRPAHLSSHILTIDYLQDEALMRYARNLHFAKLVTPAMAYEMMELGYDYMAREHDRGAIPTHFCPL